MIGVDYAAVVPHGLPFDEPFHWSTLQWYGQHSSLPVLERPGVTYTAEHPPLIDLLGAVKQRCAQTLGPESTTQLTIVRLGFTLQLSDSIVALDRILNPVRQDSTARAVGLALFALAPINMSFLWSVTNDGMVGLLTLVTSPVALGRAEPVGPSSLTMTRAVALGALLGLMLFVKITAIFAMAGVLGWLAWRTWRSQHASAGPRVHRDRLLDPALLVQRFLCLVLPLAAVAAWWFVWN